MPDDDSYLRSLRDLEWRELPEEQLARWVRLSPAVADRHIALLREAGQVARTIPPRRPCDYRPWTDALDFVTGGPAPRLRPRSAWRSFLDPRDEHGRRFIEEASALLAFSEDAATGGGWPPEHAHLVEFALTFLEEDPMWFRSGYTKKALARRLKQARLTESDIARLLPIMQRAVTQGTGLEEFKPLCRLAQKVRPPGLWEWLEEQRSHMDERVRRNARYMREVGVPWWMMHRSVQRSYGLGVP